MINLFKKFRDGLRKTSTKLATETKRIVTRAPRLDADAIDELEALLIGTDIGVDTTTRIIEQVRESSPKSGSADVFAIARDEIERELRLDNPGANAANRDLHRSPEKPTVILMVGVNGTGKTTTAPKLAKRLKSQGRQPYLTPADVHRPAAIEQLKRLAAGVGDSAPCNLNLTGRRFGRLLHELMQDDDPPIHDRAIEDARDSLCGLEAELELSTTHGAGMGHAKVWAKRLHPLRVSHGNRATRPAGRARMSSSTRWL